MVFHTAFDKTFEWEVWMRLVTLSNGMCPSKFWYWTDFWYMCWRGILQEWWWSQQLPRLWRSPHPRKQVVLQSKLRNENLFRVFSIKIRCTILLLPPLSSSMFVFGQGFYILTSLPNSICAPSLFYEVKILERKQQIIHEWTCLLALDCKNILFALNACKRFEICTFWWYPC